jgi:hypothetical protein
MHRDELHAGVLRAARQLGRVERGVIPAEPHLERDRNVDGADRRLDQRQRMIEVAHQRRACLAVGDVARRATHVDVDDLGAGADRHARALRHPMGFAAGDLHHMGADAMSLQPQHRIGLAAGKGGASRHFRHDQARAQLGRLAAEGGVGNSRHGG